MTTYRFSHVYGPTIGRIVEREPSCTFPVSKQRDRKKISMKKNYYMKTKHVISECQT